MGISIFITSILWFSCSAGEKAQAEAAGVPIDPRQQKLTTALHALPQDIAVAIAAKIKKDPETFYKLLAECAKTGDLLRLVDKTHPLPEDYSPIDLVSLKDLGLSGTRNDLSLRNLVIPDLLAMTAAAKESKVTLVFASSFRSWSYQKIVFERNVTQDGEKEANRVSARSGQSQHQLGTAFDMNPIDDAFASTPAGAWMEQNAWRFGFSLSYPQGYESVTGYVWESWHFRYLGKAAIRLQRDYFNDVQQYFLEFWNAYRVL